MSKKSINISKSESSKGSDFTFLFDQKNYKFMLIGLAFLIVGFFLMMGHDANTRPDGTYDPTYWNEGIYSFVRIRLAPFLILVGFIIEVYAILVKSNQKES